MLKEFRDFAMRGNVADMAVGIVLGAAFGRIVSSLVNDVLMPPIGLLLGRMDFSQLYINLSGGTYPTLAAARQAGAVTIAYGAFLNTVIDFLVVSFAIFLVVRWVNRLKTPPPVPAAPPAPSPEQVLLGEIRDLLKARRGGGG